MASWWSPHLLLAQRALRVAQSRLRRLQKPRGWHRLTAWCSRRSRQIRTADTVRQRLGRPHAPWRAPLPSPPRWRLGRQGERVAQAFLRSQGYRIEQTNVRYPVGEIDIVALEGETLCLIEVRSKSSNQWGSPQESIGARKRRRLIRAAEWYLSRQAPVVPAVRFDVLTIEWQGSAALRSQWFAWAKQGPVTPTITLVRNAFEATLGRW